MGIPLWEWTIAREAGRGPVGLCMTRHAAMEALSRALIAAGRPSRGRVAQVKLIKPVDADSTYLRGFPEHTATYDGTVIRWG